MLVRPRVGWYADAALSEDAFRAVCVGGLLGCTSAAASWGIVVPEGAGRRLQVSLRPGSTRLRQSNDPKRRARAGSDRAARWHWERCVHARSGWRVSPVDAILQMASCVDFRWLVAAIDSARCAAQHAALIDDDDLALLRRSLPEHLRAAVNRSDPRSETSGETFVRLELEDRRIPFEPNEWLTSAYRPDGIVAGWLPVEIDGMATHGNPEALERDHERDGTIALYTVPPLRFSQTKAVRETTFVADSIEAVWRRGRPPGLRRSAEIG
ncbi:hypothetical protein [uncultured Amnibacterium sp.]|uniref:hypothetical protein n=1 Tax=uncultured Amnibacterium sp. TaxID=1631851 RepID=UPI0035CA3ED1